MTPTFGQTLLNTFYAPILKFGAGDREISKTQLLPIHSLQSSPHTSPSKPPLRTITTTKPLVILPALMCDLYSKLLNLHVKL